MEPHQPRRQPVVPKDSPSKAVNNPRCREVMGRKTAECAAICCCCPCAAVDILILTAVKLPAGMWKKAMRKRSKRRERRELKKKMVLMGAEGGNNDEVDGSGGARAEAAMAAKSPTEEVEEKEEEMWDKFHSAGFWRSPTQRETKRVDD